MSAELERLVAGEEPIDVFHLFDLQEDAKGYAAELGLKGWITPLEEHELNMFGFAFQRQLLGTWPQREIIDMSIRHQKEILIGAMVAKKQMGAEIEGEQPNSNQIGGPLVTRACWLGVGDDWEDINGIYSGTQGAWTTGEPQDWIHSGTNLLAGTDSHPIMILENAVHVIYGLGSAHAAPKIESSKFWQDTKPRPILVQFRGQKNLPYSLRVKELDIAMLLKNKTKIRSEIMISEAFGAKSSLQTDYPYLFAASFIKEPQLALHDPADVPGTTQGVVTYT